MSDLLIGRQVLVLGATGGIGEGLTRTLLDAGARVVAAGRSDARLTALRKRLEDADRDRLALQVIDTAGAAPEAVRRELAHLGRLDGVVLSIGDWGPPGRLRIIETDDAAWNAMLANNLTSHFEALRALTPMLDRQGALVHLTGFSAEIPYPFAALVGATNAAKKSLVRSLQAELKGAGPRVYELVIGPIRTKPRAAAGFDDLRWYSTGQLGRHCAELIADRGPHRAHGLQYLLSPASGITVAPPALPGDPR